MAITKNDGRQEVIAAYVSFAFGDLTTAVAEDAIELPANARIVGGQLDVTTAWDSATSDVAVVSIGSETVLSSTSIAATGSTPFTDTQGVKTTTVTDATITWTGTGAAPAAGVGMLTILYVVEGRACFTQG